jgi:hypothetical protein
LVYAVERGICKFLLEGFASLAGWDALTGTWARSIWLPNSDARELVGNVGLDRLCRGDAGGAASAVVLFNLAIAYAR